MADFDRNTGAVIDNFQSALQGVEVTFITRLGDTIMLREFGAGLLDLLGRLMVPRLMMAFQQLIVTAIDLWEPRFQVRQILFEGSVDQLRLGSAKFGIEVDYRPRGHLGDFTVERMVNFTLTFDSRGIRAAA
jgi:phage baseplate assembly protein W